MKRPAMTKSYFRNLTIKDIIGGSSPDMAPLRAISLFSGCGGSDYALQKLGYEIVWANDIWQVACDTYEENIKNPKIECGDIRDFRKFPKAHLLVGCYPCQGYTQGGTRNWMEDDRNYLYREFDRVLRQVQPLAFVVENVNGMAFGDNREWLNNQLVRYRLAGYRVNWSVLNAKDYGVAQNRRRVFLVGVRSDQTFNYEFPKRTHGPGTKRKYVSQHDMLAGFPRWPHGQFNTEPFHWYYLSRKRRYPWGQPSPCIVGHWRHVPLHPSSPPLRRIDTDHWEFTRPGRARRFSYAECAAVQGFPKSWRWTYGNVRDRFQMIGNAVPPPLFHSVIKGMSSLW
jgi:DNA (cytosine-5)-methyltransferase 1